MMLQFWRVLHAGARNFMRNAWLSTAATVVMTITLTIIVTSFITNSTLTQTIKGVTDKIDVSIYLNDGITPDQRDSFEAALKANPNVKSVTYLSKDQVLNQYKSQIGNNQKLLEGIQLTGNPLDAEFHVFARNQTNLDSIISVTNEPDFKKLLDPAAPPSYSGQNKDSINRIVSVSNFFKTAELFASILFVIISTLIIFNTIRMAIFTRREEIEIMKLVGATKWFIRGPFIFEAAMYGIIAAIIAVILSYALLLGAGPKLSSYINVASTIDFFRSYPALIILGELIIGILIGAFSSLLAMSRYLKL